MIFTAIQNPSQTSSSTFKDMGAAGLAPTCIGEVRIVGIKARITDTISLIITSLWAFVASSLLGKEVDISKTILATAVQATSSLFPIPQLVVKFPTVSEQLSTVLSALGFQALSSNQQKLYVGPASDAALRDLVPHGADMFCLSPRNKVNIAGYTALITMNRVLHIALMTVSGVVDISADDFGFDGFFKTPCAYAFTEANLSSLPENGTFFPYFDGLLLSDTTHPIATFIRLFSSLLGNNPTDIATNSSSLMGGWKSAANTTTGRAISHLMFCLALSVDYGYPMRPVFLNNQYSGCVFIGKPCWFVQGVKVIKTVGKEILEEEIRSLHGHEAAIIAITEQLSVLPIKEGPVSTPVVISPAMITTARTLHREIIRRKITPTQQAELRTHLNKTKFNQTFWETTEDTKVQAFIHAICHKEYLPLSAPCYINSDGFFSDDPIYSGLMAFGNAGPSLIGNGTVINKTIAKDMYTSITKPGNLPGIPVFKKAAQQAFEDWRRLLGDQGSVMFSHGGKDKLGRLRVKNVAGYILYGSGSYEPIMSDLILKGGKGKKRERVEDLGEKKTDNAEDEERRKKRRLKGMGMLGMLSLPGVEAGPSTAVQMDLDDLDFD